MASHSYTVAEIEKILHDSSEDLHNLPPGFLGQLNKDKRIGVQKALARYDSRKKKSEEEFNRLKSLLVEEEFFFARGFKLVAGTDEAGRGPLAGPVVAAAVILPRGKEYMFQGLKDSKKLTPAKRENLYKLIMKEAVSAAVTVIEIDVIDDLNIHQASLLAMKRSLLELLPGPEAVLVDGFSLKGISFPQKAVIKGDARSLSIAAASVLAKVTRDRLMDNLHNSYPEYNFKQNKGYPTPEHKETLLKKGPSPVHRKTFIKNILGDYTVD